MTRLEAERLRRGLNQTTLAAKAKLSASDVSAFENRRKTPYPKQAQRLGRVLGLAASELLDPADLSRG